jgi:hypothetical protein
MISACKPQVLVLSRPRFATRPSFFTQSHIISNTLIRTQRVIAALVERVSLADWELV